MYRGGPKDYFHFINVDFVQAQKFWSGTKYNAFFGLAQNIRTDTKVFETCRRTRQTQYLDEFYTVLT